MIQDLFGGQQSLLLLKAEKGFDVLDGRHGGGISSIDDETWIHTLMSQQEDLVLIVECGQDAARPHDHSTAW